MNEFKNILDGYKERVGRIALFDLFYTMDKRQKTDREGKPIDYFGMYLLTLVFFFEKMLQRNKNISIDMLADFLRQTFEEHYQFEANDFYEIARSLIEAMRPPSGRRNRRDFYNMKQKKKMQSNTAF